MIKEIYNNETFVDIVRAMKEQNVFEKNRVWSIIDGELVSISREKVLREAFYLIHKFNGKRGLHIGIYMDASYKWLSVFLGVVLSGNIAVPLDKRLDISTLVKFVQKAEISEVIYDDIDETLLNNLLNVLCSSSIKKYVGKECDIVFEKVPSVSPETPSVMIFTSGTEGNSKCVVLSHKNIVSNILAAHKMIDYTTDTKFMNFLPISHSLGMTVSVLGSFFYGSEICFNDKPHRILKEMKLFEPTCAFIVPMMAEYILKQLKNTKKLNQDLTNEEILNLIVGKNLKYIGVGGAKISKNILLDLLDFGIDSRPGYGLTECSPLVTANINVKEYPDSVGFPLPGTSIRIVDGEIEIKSPSVMMNYYRDENATKDTMNGDWLKTGDLGYLGEDGELYLTGRKKSLIILSNGENISPEYLEDIICKSDKVQSAIVRGINQHLEAEIYPSDKVLLGTEEEIRKEIDKVIEEANKNLPQHAKIIGAKIRKEDFLRSRNGKIIRHKND